MDAVKYSKGLEAFLAYLRDMEERSRMAQADRTEAEAASQDIFHAFELWENDADSCVRLGWKLREVRRKRRSAKDTLEQAGPLVAWIRENHAVIKELEQVLGNIRKMERQAENRVYIPRTHILEDIREPDSEGGVS